MKIFNINLLIFKVAYPHLFTAYYISDLNHATCHNFQCANSNGQCTLTQNTKVWMFIIKNLQCPCLKGFIGVGCKHKKFCGNCPNTECENFSTCSTCPKGWSGTNCKTKTCIYLNMCGTNGIIKF